MDDTADVPAVDLAEASIEQNAAEPREEPGAGVRFTIEDLCLAAEWAAAEAQAEVELAERKARGEYDEDAERNRYWEEMEPAADRLAASQDPEHLHAAALLYRDPVTRIEFITRAMAAGKDNAFLVWGAVNICAGAREQSNCPLAAWSERLLGLDGQNSEAWVRAALSRWSAGDERGALRAMQQAASAAESRIYWADTVEMLERAFAGATDWPFYERAGRAFGVSVAVLPAHADLLQMCQGQSEEDLDWAYACLGYGELAERRALTVLGQSMGIVVQEKALAALGDEERLAAAVARRSRAREAYLKRDISTRQLYEMITMSNPTLFSHYFSLVREHGEARARPLADVEVERWLRQHEGLDCIP